MQIYLDKDPYFSIATLPVLKDAAGAPIMPC